MFRFVKYLGLILIFGCFTWKEAASQNQLPCVPPVKPVCTCKFANEEVEVETNRSGNEALVGAVSALSSLVLTGGGFGLYMLLKGRSSSSTTDYTRGDSSLSNNSLISKRGSGPRNYGDPPVSTKPSNVYRAAMSGKPGSANSYNNGTLSDW